MIQSNSSVIYMKNEEERLWDQSGWKKFDISEDFSVEDLNESIDKLEALFKIPIRKRD